VEDQVVVAMVETVAEGQVVVVETAVEDQVAVEAVVVASKRKPFFPYPDRIEW
jgi:hypothetical protein